MIKTFSISEVAKELNLTLYLALLRQGGTYAFCRTETQWKHDCLKNPISSFKSN